MNRLGEIIGYAGSHRLHQLLGGQYRSGRDEKQRRVQLHQVLGELEAQLLALLQIQNDQLRRSTT